MTNALLMAQRGVAAFIVAIRNRLPYQSDWGLPPHSEEMTMIHTPGSSSEADAARLRAVRYFSELCSGLVLHSMRQERLDRLRDLEARSDEELSELGLLREDIVEHVFREAHFV